MLPLTTCRSHQEQADARVVITPRRGAAASALLALSEQFERFASHGLLIGVS